MIPLAEFEFEGHEALESRQNILCQVVGSIYVHIFRSLRQHPFPHQPQQALNGAILGTETILHILNKGKPAAGFRWKLKRNNKLIQRGRTDINGLCGEMDIDFPRLGKKSSYKLSVFEPSQR